MRSIVCISLVLTLTTLTGCSRTGAFCETSEKGCCADGEVEDEDGECASTTTVFNADGFEGLDDASWLSTFDARHGRTDISLDARDAHRF